MNIYRDDKYFDEQAYIFFLYRTWLTKLERKGLSLFSISTYARAFTFLWADMRKVGASIDEVDDAYLIQFIERRVQEDYGVESICSFGDGIKSFFRTHRRFVRMPKILKVRGAFKHRVEELLRLGARPKKPYYIPNREPSPPKGLSPAAIKWAYKKFHPRSGQD